MKGTIVLDMFQGACPLITSSKRNHPALWIETTQGTFLSTLTPLLSLLLGEQTE